MIKERKGDLLRSDAAIIAHQVNCQGIMGAGVARQIRHRILTTEQYRTYQQLCRKNKEELLGACSLMLRMDTGATQYVAHLFAENIPTGRGLDTDYAALRQSLTAMMFLAAQRELSQIAIPGYLVAGLQAVTGRRSTARSLCPCFPSLALPLPSCTCRTASGVSGRNLVISLWTRRQNVLSKPGTDFQLEHTGKKSGAGLKKPFSLAWRKISCTQAIRIE